MSGGSLEELPAQLIELRDLIRQGHELMRDMTRVLREARQARDSLPKAVNAKIDAAVEAGLKQYHDELGAAIENATAATYRRFDVLTAICLGEDPESVRTGVTTVPELLRDYIAAKGLPYRLVKVPAGLDKPGEPR